MRQPIAEYFPVSFESKDEAMRFSLQALNAYASPQGMQMAARDPRPVFLQSHLPKEGVTAFVSRGAAQLLAKLGAGFSIASTPVKLSDLPNDLSLVAGDQQDYSDYTER